MSFDWTDERVSELRRLHGEGGMSASQIAVEMGAGTRNAVIGKLHRMGLGRADRLARPPPPPKPKRIARFQSHHTTCQQPVEPVMETNEATDQAIPITQRRTLVELEPGMCRWPVGHPGTPDFFFCGGTALEERPYCIHHDRRAYQPSKPQRRSTYNPARRAA